MCCKIERMRHLLILTYRSESTIGLDTLSLVLAGHASETEPIGTLPGVAISVSSVPQPSAQHNYVPPHQRSAMSVVVV